MASKTFTLVEILVVVVIVLVLATIGFVGYRKTVVRAEARKCAVNQQILTEAALIAARENGGVFPAVLGDITPEQYGTAYAKTIENLDLISRLSVEFVRWRNRGNAYAAIDELSDMVKFSEMQKYGVSADIFVCPSDPNGGVSYGINATLVGHKVSELSDATIIIGDCDNHTYANIDNLSERHHIDGAAVTQVTTVEGETFSETKSQIKTKGKSECDIDFESCKVDYCTEEKDFMGYANHGQCVSNYCVPIKNTCKAVCD